MRHRFSPPPNWDVPAGWTPPPGFRPDPAWGDAPLGWQYWVEETASADVQPSSRLEGSRSAPVPQPTPAPTMSPAPPEHTPVPSEEPASSDGAELVDVFEGSTQERASRTGWIPVAVCGCLGLLLVIALILAVAVIV